MRIRSWKKETVPFPPFVCTIWVTGQLKILQESHRWKCVNGIEGTEFHLHDHALRKFGNTFGDRSVIFFRRICKAVRTVIDCFLQPMVYLMNDFNVLLITVGTAPMPIRTTAPRTGEWARTWWFENGHLQTFVLLGERWRWKLMYPTLAIRLHQAVIVPVIYSIMVVTERAHGFVLVVRCCDAGLWGGSIR